MTVRRLDVVRETYRPVYTVWELTLACDQRCVHCGSRAEDERRGELTTEQALDVARQLAAAGAREVALIGGEAYLLGHAGRQAAAHALEGPPAAFASSHDGGRERRSGPATRPS